MEVPTGGSQVWESTFGTSVSYPTTIPLPDSGDVIAIDTYYRREMTWPKDGIVPQDFSRVPNKPRLQLNGELLYPEFILVRLLEHAGWRGGWMNNWKRTFERAIDEPIAIPDHVNAILAHIGECTGKKRSGCWDIVAWREEEIAFIESKQRRKDRLRESQLRWLSCALKVGLSSASFMVVEWDPFTPDTHEDVPCE